jgi:GNAT superfamily N-acetyltransferase
MEIRQASIEDAEEICTVVRRSIVELCTADHCGNPAILAPWLDNKTPEAMGQWIANRSNHVFVAVDGAVMLAAGCVNDAGEVILNYVSPDARFQGASRALLAEMEFCVWRFGHAAVTLSSTATALRFYRDSGYVDDGPSGEKHGLRTYPMRKSLSTLTRGVREAPL